MQRKSLHLTSILVTGVLMTGIFGCDKKTDCCTIIDVDVQIHYKNKLGDNLINSHPEFEESNIKVYYKDGDAYKYIHNENLDSPNMHRIDKDESGNLILTVYPSNYYNLNQSTTLIELNQNVVDTLICEFDLGSNREICKRAWLNGTEVYNRFIEIEK